MKTLYVLRHAKAERDAPSGEDYDRPLAARGRTDAARLGSLWQIHPDLIVTSSAKRTLETVEQLTARWPKPVAIQAEDKLYLAPAARLMETVRTFPDTAHSAILVGHNPGIGDLAAQLAHQTPGAARERIRTQYPTCALATFEIAADSWSLVSPGLARLLAFAAPKDLANGTGA